jgi:hypothetical protein
MRQALREKAPSGLAAVLVTAAAFLPAAVMGADAGLEILQPFAVTLLSGLLSSSLVVFLVIPSLYAGFAGPRPPDTVGEDAPGTAPSTQRTVGGELQDTRGGGMARIGRSLRVTSLLVAGLGVAGCDPAHGPDTVVDRAPATVETQDGGPPLLTLTERAEQRLGIETAAAVNGGGATLVIPYSALVYDADGAAWAFVRTAPQTYTRAAVTIGAVSGGQVTLAASGLAPDAQVVTVGAPELVGIETGLDGEE